MTAVTTRARWLGAPIWIRILALLVGGLIAAQAVTLALTVLLPPAPPQQHSLAEIAQALKGGPLAGAQGAPLIRTVETAPPSLQSPGWVVSERSTRQLATLVGVPETEVRLLFYAPPPLAGTGPPPPRGLPPSAALDGETRLALAGFLMQAGPPPGPPGGGGMGPGPSPGGMRQGGAGGFGPPPPGAAGSMRPMPSAPRDRRPGARAGMAGTPQRAPLEGGPVSAGPARPDAGFAGAPVRTPMVRAPLDAAVFGSRTFDTSPLPVQRQPPAAPPPPPQYAPPMPVPVSPEPAVAAQPPTLRAPMQPDTPVHVLAGPMPAATASAARPPPSEDRALPAPARAGVFGLARAPYVEGQFVAALRGADGRWVTVKPQPEGFPNSWQRRVLLWFGLSFALVAPLGVLFARRLARPLHDFAEAAERLGREPAADIPPLGGPAEIGRAAAAFNLMQRRLKRYVEDRTGMVGAISHDLRTPLARMRFKLERAPPALKAALTRDIAQMEEMITSVLSFMRDDASSGAREPVDLRSILEVVVDDMGAGAELAPGASVAVEVDLLAIQRVFENLVDNALKYGGAARLRLAVEGDEAVVEVADDGPGLPAADLEQAFKPFYRSAEAKASGKAGMGLGLAVSRATVRAHGGELVLKSAGTGLVAQVRLPLPRRIALAA